MVRISKSGDQFRLTIPREVIVATKWNQDTEIIFVPILDKPTDEINNKTTFFLKVVGK